MFVRHFGVTGRAVSLLTESGERIPTFRAELRMTLWNGQAFDSIGIRALWDTGADFVTLSEQTADDLGIDCTRAADRLGSVGTAGSSAGVLVPLVFQLAPIRDLAFRVQCQVLLGADFLPILFGNLFVRRNFNVQTAGERRTYFRLRERAPDAVSVAELRTA